jgi:hypothetical protein
MAIYDCLQGNVHQTCTYIDKYTYTHKYACMCTYTGEYKIIVSNLQCCSN